MTRPDEPFSRAERAGLLVQIRALVADLNNRLRVLAMGGHPVNVDTVERRDPLTGGEYSEIVVSGQMPEEDDTD